MVGRPGGTLTRGAALEVSHVYVMSPSSRLSPTHQDYPFPIFLSDHASSQPSKGGPSLSTPACDARWCTWRTGMTRSWAICVAVRRPSAITARAAKRRPAGLPEGSSRDHRRSRQRSERQDFRKGRPKGRLTSSRDPAQASGRPMTRSVEVGFAPGRRAHRPRSALPAAVRRYRCLRLFGLSGWVISMSPASSAGSRYVLRK